MKLLQIIKKIFALLLKHEQKQLYWILAAILVMGGVEVIGIGSIMPFLSVAANPDIIQTNHYLRWGYETFGFSTQNAFLIACGLLTIAVLAITQTYSAFTMYLIKNYTGMRNYHLSVRLFHKYIHHPYPYFLNHNSTGLNKMVLAEVQQVVKKVMMPLIDLLTQSVTSICIIGFLFFLDPLLSILVTIILGGAYLLVFLAVKSMLGRIGQGRFDANGMRFKITAEAFGGIKDIKILGKENVFVIEFRDWAKKFAKYTIHETLIANFPHYAISLIAFSGILLITIYLIAVKENFQQAVPMIGLYTFAGYRLLPAIRGIYGQLTEIRSGLPALDVLYEDLLGHSTDIDFVEQIRELAPLPFKNSLELQQIGFAYPNTTFPVIKDLELRIQANTCIGIVGVTGCGKTTLVDIILGLLLPKEGTLSVDGVNITDEHRQHWQQNLGYVPQQIFLSDNTVTQNIAFGIPEDEIDRHAVEKAAKIANLHEFVIDELPNGYETVVGERGIRLSGGQRQRIGIARALYRDPTFLIFDEATSSLDNITETVVMDAINNLSGQKTIIIIAHRLTTVKACDVIYLMENGKFVAQGSYDALLRTSPQFREMVSVGNEKVQKNSELREVSEP